MFLNELFIEILKMSLTASVIALVIIILRKTLKPVIPKGMFICLWTVFILKLLLPVEIPSPTSLYNKVDINDLAIISELDDTEAQAESVQDENAQRQETLSYSQVANEDEVQNVSAALSIKEILSIIYLCLFALITGVFFIMYLKTYYKIKKAAPLDDLTALRIVNEYEIKRSIRLRKLPGIKSPMVFGVFRPVIVFPEDYDFSSENELRHLLAHEIQHIRNFDNLWNYLMLLSLCVHFFNPLVWVCRRLFTRDMEIACDGRVLSGLSTDDRRDYAETILSIAGKGAQKAPALAMGFNKIDLKERLKSVARFKKSTKLGIGISGVVVISVILIFATGIFNAGVNKLQSPDDLSESEETEIVIVRTKADRTNSSEYEQPESSYQSSLNSTSPSRNSSYKKSSSSSGKSVSEITGIKAMGSNFPLTFADYMPEGRKISYSLEKSSDYTYDYSGIGDVKYPFINPRIINSIEELKAITLHDVSLDKLYPKYRKSFFDYNSLIHLTIKGGKYIHGYEIESIVKKDTELCINIKDTVKMDISFEKTYVLIIEVKKSNVKDVNGFTFYYQSDKDYNSHQWDYATLKEVNSRTAQGTDFPVTYINYAPEGKSIFYNTLKNENGNAMGICGYSREENKCWLDPRLIDSIEKFRRIYGHDETYDEYTKKYNSEYFKENVLVTLSFGTSHMGHFIEVDNVIKKGTELYICIKDRPGTLTATGWSVVSIELKKTDVENIGGFTFYYRKRAMLKGHEIWHYSPPRTD